MALWDIENVRREILALTKTASYRPSNFYKSLTTRIKELLGDLQVLKGDETVVNVDLIYANPERAIAKISESKNTILPLMSLQFDGLKVDSMRRRPLENIVERKFWDTSKQRAVRFMALAPVAATLTYVVNVWGKYIEEVNQLTEQLALKFRPNLPVDISESEVYQAFVVDFGEATSLTAANREDRVVKRTLRFEVQSYIPSDVFRFTNTGEIASMNFDVYTELVSEGTLVPLESFDMSSGGFTAASRVPFPPTITTTSTTTTSTTTTEPTTTTTSTTTTEPTTTTTSTTTTEPTTTTTSTTTTEPTTTTSTTTTS